MRKKTGKGNISMIKLSVGLCLLGVILSFFVIGVPVGPTLKSSSTDSYTAPSALMINDTKGSINRIWLNASQQSTNWKAYVGNVSGRLTLEDNNDKTIYDWTYVEGEGEVYATRGSSVTWTAVMCANTTTMNAEESALNQVASHPDSITSTFENSTHSQFYVGSTNFAQNDCGITTYTWVNGSKADTFEEILLYETTNDHIIYTAIMVNQSLGFDEDYYDFQMLLAEDATITQNHAYYFYVELS